MRDKGSVCLRIRRIRVTRWRHFENVELLLGDDAPLVCIVGANGTGKSHFLELIASCAHRLGIAQGTEIPRGDPFGDPHEFTLQFFVAPGVSQPIDQGLAGEPAYPTWDRTLTLTSNRTEQAHTLVIAAGGIEEPGQSENFANMVVRALNQSADVHFVSLDADRAYPKKNIHANEIAQAYDIDWLGAEYTRGRSFRTTAMLYDEWIKYFLAQENQAGTRLITETRRARERGTQDPTFTDHFVGYRDALRKVLPHIVFTGVDSKKRTLLFDTTGMELSFNQLSGGEREIAFLIGQIDRFQLRDGLFLLDEPELHLNADLIRTWVAFLTSTVSTGQIWLATHSLEAAEAAGQQATFVLERNATTRKVDILARLDSRPVLSALARAVGTPAFSISQLRFLFIEGEVSVGERERFRNLCASRSDVRFIECGSGKEVIRRVLAVRALSTEAEAHIRIGGVVDRDWQTDRDAQRLMQDNDIYVLSVHEVENFFLHPATVQTLLNQNGRDDLNAADIVRIASDERAGSWLLQYAMATPNARDMPELPSITKERGKALTWDQIAADHDQSLANLVATTRFDQDNAMRFADLLRVGASAYAKARTEPSLWKKCEGKEVLNAVARSAGFADQQALSQAAYALWSKDAAAVSEELAGLRSYLSKL